ncbi:MAG: PTS sugar transporter subunit IIA [Acidobacteriota bacterium]|nr:PTS sugar transporter subunit IIA [Acidobacteriota bacterium]
MHLQNLTRPELIFSELPGTDGPTVLRALAERVAAIAPQLEADNLYHRLLEREALSSTGIGDGVAIPHCKLQRLDNVLMAVGLSSEPVEFGAIDNKPVRLFFLVASPEKQPAEHLKALSSLSRWLKTDHHVDRMLELSAAEEIFRLLAESEED